MKILAEGKWSAGDGGSARVVVGRCRGPQLM